MGDLQQGEFLSLTNKDLEACIVREHGTVANPENEPKFYGTWAPVKVAIYNDFQPQICPRSGIPDILSCERTSLFLK